MNKSLKLVLKNFEFFFSVIGINIHTVLSLKNLFRYIKEYLILKKQLKDNGVKIKFGKFIPVLTDFNDTAGVAKGHYFHQDLHVSQLIFKSNPVTHIDVGSRIDGFVTNVASFREIKIIDIRPLVSNSKNIEFLQADLMNFDNSLENICDSLSCLHVIEHFGLGRYNDPIDAQGHEKGFDNLTKLLKPNGKLYFSIPIGPERIEFNAHRVFEMDYILNLINKNYKIISFSYVDDFGNLYINQELNSSNIKANFGCNYGCGIFELRKV